MNKREMDKGGGLKWELIDIENKGTSATMKFYRARIVAGWLVRAIWDGGVTMTYVPDAYHIWNVK